MAKLFGAQRMVLQAVNDLPKHPAGYVTDDQISRATGIDVSEVRDWIETLEGGGHIEVAKTGFGLSACISAGGRLALSRSLSGSSADDNNFREKPLKLVVMGLTGTGKSLLINKISGKEEFEVSHVVPGTKANQSVTFEISGQKIECIDCPGIGSGLKFDKKYFELYRQIIPKATTVLWVVRADSRIISLDELYFGEVQDIALRSSLNIQLVLTYCDRIQPGDWDERNNRPSDEQSRSLDRRAMYLLGTFQLPDHEIVMTSSTKNYNIDKLKERIVRCFRPSGI